MKKESWPAGLGMGRGVRPGRASWGAFAPEGQKKKPAASYSRAGGSRTTLGEEALDCRVRNGNGYCRLSVATGEKVPVAWKPWGGARCSVRGGGLRFKDEVGNKLILTSD